MAQDLEELRKKLEAFRDNPSQDLLPLATTISITAKALANRTIVDRGIGYTYSKNPLPAFFFYGKELNQSGKSFLEKLTNKDKSKSKKKKIEDITEADLIEGSTTWGEFRAAQGLQNDHVDLTYTGKMWAGMFPQEAFEEGAKYIAPLGHNNREGQNEMNWNKARYGDFIGKALTGDNLAALGKMAQEELINILKKRKI